MLWITGGLVAFFVVVGRISVRRHANDPARMPYQTGHFGGLGEAPMPTHHRLGSRRA